MSVDNGSLAQPFGYRWRSSKLFIVMDTTDTFLFSFIVPILPAILEGRIRLAQSQTQFFTSVILSMNALVSIALALFIGYLADRVSSKNNLMILSWVINIVGTVVTGWSKTLTWLFVGRLLQTVAGSFIWIAGMAILGNAVGPNHLAKAIGLVTLFVSAGLLCGPAVSGTLYQIVSYFTMWTSPFAVLVLGIILQFLVIEVPHSEDESIQSDSSANGEETLVSNNNPDEEQRSENSPLLTHESGLDTGYQTLSGLDEHIIPSQGAQQMQSAKPNVYVMLLCKRRVLTALLADIVFAMMIASFETTIPIHIKQVFAWETMQAGLLFLLLQLPSLVLLMPAGWLKDKIGMHYPVAVGFILFAPSLWLLGVPGDDGFEWANHGNTGQKIYIVTLLAIGAWRTLLLGFGGVQVMHGANELMAEFPTSFGRGGAYSRAFSLSNISWKLGMFLGPLLSGILSDSVGYYYMNVSFGTFCFCLFLFHGLISRRTALLCFITGISTLLVFRNS
ncbi:MFS general substrate transporter [Penicillium fimorum]|uniref:MFS general substrate transporter n=1 Tax=Penicillium fimorum TaxID=1882269 RepID=A0A9X0CAY7_9EURO|nr:MFS general substrate transporter [Penicillium fimorum]